MIAKDINRRNMLQAYGLVRLAEQLPGEGWQVDTSRFEPNNQIRIRLSKLHKPIHTTTSPLGMHTYISAIIALEGK